MNDFPFGNYLLKKREQLGLSQAELADLVGITNKAVSKWENGKSKPSIDILKKLSILFKVSIDELLYAEKEKKKPVVSKIVITGGPCAGKSTALSRIQTVFTQLGYCVLFVPETATDLINSGVAPWSFSSVYDYQLCQIRMQIEKEKIYALAANTIQAEKVLIVCDRGTIDSKAYMNEAEFQALLSTIGTNEIDLRDQYDAVFHLVTAANGAENYYTLSGNTARTESPEQARVIDDKLISAWTGHPHFRIIDNQTDFDEKIKHLISEISSFLGEPKPFEVERKFLIQYPDIKWLESNLHCQRIEIIQTYLLSSDEDEIRVRQRGYDGNYVYYKTVKKKISNMKRVEIEHRLTKEEYLNLLMEADTSKNQIRKTRYCLTYESQYFEIDVYPFWDNQAIAEIELNNEKENIRFPPQLHVIREVTDDEAYKNYRLAGNHHP